MNVNKSFKNWRWTLMNGWLMFNYNCRGTFFFVFQLYLGVMKIKILRNINDTENENTRFLWEKFNWTLRLNYMRFTFIFWYLDRLCSTMCSDFGSLYFGCESHSHYLFRMKIIVSQISLCKLSIFRDGPFNLQGLWFFFLKKIFWFPMLL